MKERIVIEEKTFKDFLLKHKDNHEICSFSPLVIMSRCRVEQVPENFNELIELCKNIKGVEFAGGKAKGEIIQVDNIWFAENGEIWGYNDEYTAICNIAKNRTPQQMWEIIKSLVGEE